MRSVRILAAGAALAWFAAVICWLGDIVGVGVPRRLSQAAVLASVALSAAAAASASWYLWRQSDSGAARTAGRSLLLLVLLALAMQWVGVDWEVTGRYYRDEGIYYAAANDINAGDLFPKSFIYGHLPYYLYALALWIQSLFPLGLARVVEAVFGVGKEVDVSWILLRGINTTLGALTVVPVFVIGRRIAGLAAAVVGGLLIVFSPIYNEITRLLISDVPSAFFAALSLMFVALLLDEERWWPYLAAGVAAAMAAASKYPAGVVVVAIVGIWLAWRIRTRSWSWHLVAAGAVSLATFVAVMPAFVANSEEVFVGQGKDLLFGFRQYGKGGWIGVQPQSIALWYGGQLLASFGLPAILLGLVGWLRLPRESRRRLIWMLPFPVLYLLLLASMSMVVKRNLLPVLPALAAVLAVGVVAWLSPGSTIGGGLGRWRNYGLLALALALPAYRTTAQTVAMARQSTREAAVEWIETHLPRGAAIIKESYTPHVHKRKYTVRQTRFLPRVPMEEVRNGQWDFILLARNAYLRFLDPVNWEKPHHELFASAYREMLEFEKVAEFVPGPLRLGPALELYKADPAAVVYQDHFRYAFEGEGFRFPRDDAYLLLKGYLAAGRYEISVVSQPSAARGRVEIVSRDGRRAGSFEVEQGRGVAALPWDAKYFLYIYLGKDTVIDAIELRP